MLPRRETTRKGIPLIDSDDEDQSDPPKREGVNEAGAKAHQRMPSAQASRQQPERGTPIAEVGAGVAGGRKSHSGLSRLEMD